MNESQSDWVQIANMRNLKNRVAVITGAASGLGREIAIVACNFGMKLVLADVQKEPLERAKIELEGLGAQVLAVLCDVSKLDDVRAVANAAMKKFGAVHLLFNNAGVGTGGLIWENSDADWQWVLGVNLWGSIHGINVFIPLMLECAERDPDYRGHVINTSSVAGFLNSPLLGIYNTSKHAVVSLSEQLYKDLKLVEAPIGCTLLCPYWMQTNINDSHRNRPEELANDEPATDSQNLSAAIVNKAVSTGATTAKQMADLTFEAILEDRFYVFPDSKILQGVETKMQDILQQRNPSDPYAQLPQVRKYIERGLKLQK